MTFRERLASWISPKNAGAIQVSDPSAFVHLPWLAEAGVIVTAETALQVSAVYACCRLIVDSLAPAPIRVYEVGRGGRRSALPDDSTSYVLNWGASRPDAPPSQAIEEALFWSALLTGNGYAEIQKDTSGRFVALWPLEPDRVMPKRNQADQYVYEISMPKGGTVQVPPDRIFHVRGPSLFGWVGDSTVYRAAKAVGIAQAAQVYSAAYFAKGTVISGVLEYAGKMHPEAKKEVRADWDKKYAGGPNTSHGTPILEGGLKYVQINHDAQKSQLNESRRFQVQEVARFYGVPTTLLADNEAWTNLTELYLGFYRNALLPWAERFDAEATRKLFPQRNPWREVQHDLTRIVMGSFKEQVAALREAVNGGLKSRNEAREILGDNDMGPDGDVFVVESGVQTLETMLSPPAPVVQAPAKPPMEDEEDRGDPDEREPEESGAPVNRPDPLVPLLEKHRKRIKARRANLEKAGKTEAEIAANLARLHEKHAADVIAALASSEHVEPSKAAEHLRRSTEAA